MKTILTLCLMTVALLASVASATDCGHLNDDKCQTQDVNLQTIFDNPKYQHFGRVAKGFDGKLSLVYREGTDHGGSDPSATRDGEIFFIQSSDNGKTWGPKDSAGLIMPKKLSNDGIKEQGEIDYRDVSIGYTGQGTLITTYTRKDYEILTSNGSPSTSWLYRMSVDNGKTWTNQANIDLPPTGLLYGQLSPIPSADGADENRVITTGYYSAGNIDHLANWMGTVSTTGASSTIVWTSLNDTKTTPRPPGEGYAFNEHTILPLTDKVWIAASRGTTSINLFRTTDAGLNWSAPVPMTESGDLPFPEGDGLSKYVAPTLDVMNVGDDKYLVLLYTQRPCNTTPTMDSVLNSGACSVLRVGKGGQHLIDTEIDQIIWSDNVGISSFDETGDSLSGYQSGVFLNNDISKYFHLEFHEKYLSANEIESDIQSRIINFRDIYPNLVFPQQTLEPLPNSNILENSYFNGISGLPLTPPKDNGTYPLGSDWNLKPSGADVTVEIDNSDFPGHPRHLNFNVRTGDPFLGLNQEVSGGYGQLTVNDYAQVSFYAKTDPGESLDIYYYLSTIGPDEEIASQTITVDDTWKPYVSCFVVPKNLGGSNTDIRLTIGYPNGSNNDLTIDNILLSTREFCP